MNKLPVGCVLPIGELWCSQDEEDAWFVCGENNFKVAYSTMSKHQQIGCVARCTLWWNRQVYEYGMFAEKDMTKHNYTEVNEIHKNWAALHSWLSIQVDRELAKCYTAPGKVVGEIVP
jgi:hypothetical protein